MVKINLIFNRKNLKSIAKSPKTFAKKYIRSLCNIRKIKLMTA